MARQQHLAVAVVLSALIASGCAVAPAPPLKAYEGPEKHGSELALLDWSGCGSPCVLEIDGKEVHRSRATQAWLEPGRHRIVYGGTYGYTGGLYIRRSVSYRKCADLDMLPGAQYAVFYSRRRGWEIGNFRDYFWIEEKASREIVAGQSPASPPPARGADVEC